ncbi:MAG: hypothetical protein ACOH5I_26630 [Oligoflexus sp.]
MALPKFKESERPSHYQYKNWRFQNGIRAGAYSVNPVERPMADLISTAVKNPAKGTQTVLTLDLDIDFKRTQDKWLNGDRVDWQKVSSHLREQHEPVFDAIDAVVMSTSGSGFHLLIGVQPLEMGYNPRQQWFRYRAETVQRRLIKLLNDAGIGADPAAAGLVRDYPNHFKTERLLYGSELRLTESQRFSSPDKIEALDEYLESIGYPRKDKAEAPFGEARVAQGVAKLYLHLAEAFADGDPCVMMPLSKIQSITGSSAPFLRKLLKESPEWLLAEWCGKGEGWKLGIRDNLKLLRAAERASEGQIRRQRSARSYFELCPPEDVEDGERNEWLWRLAVLLKLAGYVEFEALRLIGDAIKRIPGGRASRNCRSYRSIVGSIYKREAKDSEARWRRVELPKWLWDNASKEKKINRTEGDEVPGSDSVEITTEAGPASQENKTQETSPGVWGSSPVQDVRGSVKIGRSPQSFASQGAQVIAFTSKPALNPALALLAAYAPEAARVIQAREASQTKPTEKPAFISLEQAAQEECARIDAELAVKAEKPAPTGQTVAGRYRTLKEKRRTEFKDVDPVERFLKAYERCRTRYCDKVIFEKLHRFDRLSAHMGIREISKGRFRRLLQSYLLLPVWLRLEVLKGLHEQIHGGSNV